MGQRERVSEAIAEKLKLVKPGAVEMALDEQPKRSWFLRATDWVGITMSRTDTPSGWQLNPATVTLALIVAGGILTGGYLWGENVTERRHLLERIAEAEKRADAAVNEAAEAKKFSIYATAGADEAAGHKPNQKEKKK